MWLLVRQEEPDDYVIATGETHSVRELAECAFAHVGLDWQDHVKVDETLIRGKAELHDLVGDPSKARERLGWSPEIDFEGLVHLLVDADVTRLRAQLEPSTAV
jgi:GDPmannose 4,6-dehydratase